jgi:RecB family exonuclease
VPWPAARRLWQARLDRVADWFLDIEAQRPGVPALLEGRGAVVLEGLGVTLTARADRIDTLADGSLEILDYKTGAPPKPQQQKHFAKQLLLEAAMAERGGFAELGPRPVAGVAYVGMGTTPKIEAQAVTPELLAEVWEELGRLLSGYLLPGQGYAARRAPWREEAPGDYDHLARWHEWERSDPPVPEDVGDAEPLP